MVINLTYPSTTPQSDDSIETTVTTLPEKTISHIRHLKVDIQLERQELISGSPLPFLTTIRDLLQNLASPMIQKFELLINFVEPDPEGGENFSWFSFQDLSREILFMVRHCTNLTDLILHGELAWLDQDSMAELIENLPDLKRFEFQSPDLSLDHEFQPPGDTLDLAHALASRPQLSSLSLLGPMFPHPTWTDIPWKAKLQDLVLGTYTSTLNRPLIEFAFVFKETLQTLEIHERIETAPFLHHRYALEMISLKTLTISAFHIYTLKYLVDMSFCPSLETLRVDVTPPRNSFVYFDRTLEERDRRAPKWPKLKEIQIGSIDPESDSRDLQGAIQTLDHLNLNWSFLPLNQHATRDLPRLTQELESHDSWQTGLINDKTWSIISGNADHSGSDDEPGTPESVATPST